MLQHRLRHSLLRATTQSSQRHSPHPFSIPSTTLQSIAIPSTPATLHHHIPLHPIDNTPQIFCTPIIATSPPQLYPLTAIPHGRPFKHFIYQAMGIFSVIPVLFGKTYLDDRKQEAIFRDNFDQVYAQLHTTHPLSVAFDLGINPTTVKDHAIEVKLYGQDKYIDIRSTQTFCLKNTILMSDMLQNLREFEKKASTIDELYDMFSTVLPLYGQIFEPLFAGIRSNHRAVLESYGNRENIDHCKERLSDIIDYYERMVKIYNAVHNTLSYYVEHRTEDYLQSHPDYSRLQNEYFDHIPDHIASIYTHRRELENVLNVCYNLQVLLNTIKPHWKDYISRIEVYNKIIRAHDEDRCKDFDEFKDNILFKHLNPGRFFHELGDHFNMLKHTFIPYLRSLSDPSAQQPIVDPLLMDILYTYEVLWPLDFQALFDFKHRSPEAALKESGSIQDYLQKEVELYTEDYHQRIAKMADYEQKKFHSRLKTRRRFYKKNYQIQELYPNFQDYLNEFTELDKEESLLNSVPKLVVNSSPTSARIDLSLIDTICNQPHIQFDLTRLGASIGMGCFDEDAAGDALFHKRWYSYDMATKFMARQLIYRDTTIDPEEEIAATREAAKQLAQVYKQLQKKHRDNEIRLPISGEIIPAFQGVRAEELKQLEDESNDKDLPPIDHIDPLPRRDVYNDLMLALEARKHQVEEDHLKGVDPEERRRHMGREKELLAQRERNEHNSAEITMNHAKREKEGRNNNLQDRNEDEYLQRKRKMRQEDEHYVRRQMQRFPLPSIEDSAHEYREKHFRHDHEFYDHYSFGDNFYKDVLPSYDPEKSKRREKNKKLLETLYGSGSRRQFDNNDNVGNADLTKLFAQVDRELAERSYQEE